MPGNSLSPTKASQALKTWMAATETSQVKLAVLVTRELRALGRVPVNQSTVSAWARGASIPGGQAMVAIQKVTEIPVDDWIVPAEIEHQESENDAA